jgi:polyisoprenoid-binding protein YceI
VARRDEHVRSAGYLDVATHPEIAFRGEGVEMDSDVTVVTGQLTVLGVCRPVDVTVESVAVEGRRLTVVGSAVVDRCALGVTTAKGTPPDRAPGHQGDALTCRDTGWGVTECRRRTAWVCAASR